MESGGSRTSINDGEVIRGRAKTGGTMDSGSSSKGTADRMVIGMGAAPPLPVAPSRKRNLGGGRRPEEDVTFKTLLVGMKHRDGSILNESSFWHKLYCTHITDESKPLIFFFAFIHIETLKITTFYAELVDHSNESLNFRVIRRFYFLHKKRRRFYSSLPYL
jgi:hypothetical protein